MRRSREPLSARRIVPAAGVAACLAAFLSGCGAGDGASGRDATASDASPTDATAADAAADAATSDARPVATTGVFAASVVTFEPGPGAGFGADKMPAIVLGPPHGAGAKAGSLDVVSLGKGGTIVLGFDGVEIVDGPGADFVVFENPFTGWIETGEVSVSADGQTWATFPCAAADKAGGYPGCAGVGPVHAAPDNAIDPAAAAAAGGDAFDLADLGLPRARFVRVRDSGANGADKYLAPTGGFDLDAVVAIHHAAAR